MLQVLIDIFPVPKDQSFSLKTRQIGYLIVSLLELGQLTNLMWTSSTNIEFWDTILPFWETISFASLDSLCSIFGILNVFVIFVGCSASLIMTLFFIHLLLTKLRGQSFTFITKVIRNLIFIHSEIFFVCYCIGLNLLIKYSFVQKGKIEEYSQNMESNILNYGSFGVVFGIIFQIFHLIISILYTGCSYEIRYLSKDSEFHSKSEVKYEILFKTFLFISTLMYCFADKDFYLKRLLFMIFLDLASLIYYFKKTPYYSNFMNFLRLLKSLECLLISISFIISYILDNSIISLVLSIFMQPVLILISLEAINYRQAHLPNSIQTFCDFELLNRQSLKSKSIPKRFIKSCNFLYSSTKDPKFLIFESYFCLDYLRNPSLALIKLARSHQNTSNIFTRFQTYKCQYTINQCRSETNGLKICKFVTRLARVIENDRKFCITLISFLQKLKIGSDIKVLARDLFEYTDFAKQTKKMYEELLTEYPESSILCKNYISFETEFFSEKIEDSNMLSKAVTHSSVYSNKKKNEKNFNSLDAMVLVFEGNDADSGDILYISNSLATFVGVEAEELKKSKVQKFLPDFKQFDFERMIKKFVENTENEVVEIKRSIFIKDKDNFLLECYVNIECVEYENKVRFVSLFEPCDKKREYALIEETGEIINHSIRFSEYLDLPQCNLQNHSIFLLSSISHKLLISESAGKLESQNNQYYSCKKLKILYETVFIVYFYKEYIMLSIDEEAEPAADLFNLYFSRETKDSKETKENLKIQIHGRNSVASLNIAQKNLNSTNIEEKSELKISNQTTIVTSKTSVYENIVNLTIRTLKILKLSIILLVFSI